MWARNCRNITLPASASLSALYTNYAAITTLPLISDELYEIQNFDIFYDTLLLKTPNYLLLNKIEFNFETNLLDFNINNSHIINLSANNAQFAGTWFFDTDKDVTIAMLVSSVSGIYPQLRNLDLENNQMTYIYNETSLETNQLSSLGLTSIEEPVFTYNKDSFTYNMAFIGHSSSYESMLIGNIFITDSGDAHYVSKVNVITPLN